MMIFISILALSGAAITAWRMVILNDLRLVMFAYLVGFGLAFAVTVPG